MDSRQPNVEELRLSAALGMADFGVELQRQNLRREYPDASDEEIRRRLGAWLLARPGAEQGDGQGRPRPLQEPGDAVR